MAEDYPQRSHTLGPGCTDIVLAQYIKHAASCKPDDVGHWRKAQGYYRKNKALCSLTVGRNKPQLYREKEEHQRPHDEGRHGDEGGGDDHDYPVQDSISLQSCRSSQHYAGNCGPKGCNQSQLG